MLAVLCLMIQLLHLVQSPPAHPRIPQFGALFHSDNESQFITQTARGGLYVRKTKRLSAGTAYTTFTVSVETALEPADYYKHGDIVQVLNLKAQKNQSLDQIAKHFNKSFGIIMPIATQLKHCRIQVRLQWFADPAIKAGIKEKYLKHRAYPSIYIHDLSAYSGNAFILNAINLFQTIVHQKNKDVINLIFDVSSIRNENVFHENLINTYSKSIDLTKDLDTKKVSEWVKYFGDIPETLPWRLLPEVMEKLYSKKTTKKHQKLIQKIQKLYDLLYDRYKLLANETLLGMFRNNDEAQRIIRDKIGVELRDAKKKDFWNGLREIVIERNQDMISHILSNSTMKAGFPLALDVVNSYVAESLPASRDLHVFCQTIEAEYSEIIEDIGDRLLLSPHDEPYKHLLAASIVKKVVHNGGQILQGCNQSITAPN